jgi:hypothetical protein
MKLRWMSLGAALLLAACGAPVEQSATAGTSVAKDASLDSDPPKATVGFQRVTNTQWNDTAVRKVLRTFAYGGQADEVQIRKWANMTPRAAIVEMLTFDTHNLKLSPVAAGDTDALDTIDGSMKRLSMFWAGAASNNNTPAERRQEFRLVSWDAPQRLWVRMARSHGLNPFRQKIGLWETNYHLAVNTAVGVNYAQVARYYDDILNALAARKPYQQVLATAAESAAVATQYGHRYNRWVNGECLCNEDFAREFHQLFFGILGAYNPGLHERQTIKNTARALTDMDVPWTDAGLAETVTFGTQYHKKGNLIMLETTLAGNTAKEHLDQLADVAIVHPESLDALPVKIIEGLADEKLDAAKIAQIRQEWASQPTKNLLEFLREYAISTIFHAPSRVKHLTSIDRYMTIAVQSTVNNLEPAIDLYYPQYGINDDNVYIFSPTHNVFGGQTGLEAAASGEVFRNHYLRSTEYNWVYPAEYQNYGVHYFKNWRPLVAGSLTDNYRVKLVGELLWNRFIGDGLKNFGPIERAQVYAFLARGLDFAAAIDEPDPEHVYTSSELATPRLTTRVDGLGNQQMALASTTAGQRREANWRIQQAIDFIIATPYMFVDEGR